MQRLGIIFLLEEYIVSETTMLEYDGLRNCEENQSHSVKENKSILDKIRDFFFWQFCFRSLCAFSHLIPTLVLQSGSFAAGEIKQRLVEILDNFPKIIASE
jgi:hypothetical protein